MSIQLIMPIRYFMLSIQEKCKFKVISHKLNQRNFTQNIEKNIYKILMICFMWNNNIMHTRRRQIEFGPICDVHFVNMMNFVLITSIKNEKHSFNACMCNCLKLNKWHLLYQLEVVNWKFWALPGCQEYQRSANTLTHPFNVSTTTVKYI